MNVAELIESLESFKERYGDSANVILYKDMTSVLPIEGTRLATVARRDATKLVDHGGLLVFMLVTDRYCDV